MRKKEREREREREREIGDEEISRLLMKNKMVY